MFDNISVEREIEVNPIGAASIRFECANCGKICNYRTPVRRNDFGPYFDTFYCAWKYFANLGDEKAAEMVAKMNKIMGTK